MISDGKEKKRNNFTLGVVILSLSAIIVKIIGLVYKIPMLRLLGSEGMGYFNSAYEIYALFCSIATTGLPVAMSVMISSGKERGEKAVFRAALKLFLLLGFIGCALILAFSIPFSNFLGSINASPSLSAIAPCVILICVSSSYRGYFQGKGRMAPTAVSQMIEALGKLILGLIFALVALESGLSTAYVAAFAVMGLTLGTAASVLYLILVKRFSNDDSTLIAESEKGIMKRLLALAVPITVSSAVVSLTKVIDTLMIVKRLQSIGMESSEAFAVYGNYTTLALPLFSLAPALITAVAMPLIPSLSPAVANGDQASQTAVVSDAMKLTSLISMPISLGLTLFARPILELIFKGENTAIESAAPLLTVLGLSVVSSCFITVGNAILQAYGRSTVPIFSMAFGAVSKIAVSYILIGCEGVGIIGAPIGTLVCDTVINTINFYFIGKVMPCPPKVGKTVGRPFICAALSISLSRLAYNALLRFVGEGSLVTFFAIALAAIIYFVVCFLLGVVDREDISKLPFVIKVFN